MDIIVSICFITDETIIGLTSFSHLLNALKSPVFTSEVNININKLIYLLSTLKTKLLDNKENKFIN